MALEISEITTGKTNFEWLVARLLSNFSLVHVPTRKSPKTQGLEGRGRREEGRGCGTMVIGAEKGRIFISRSEYPLTDPLSAPASSVIKMLALMKRSTSGGISNYFRFQLGELWQMGLRLFRAVVKRDREQQRDANEKTGMRGGSMKSADRMKIGAEAGI